MANAIVVIVVIIIMLFAGKGAYKHLKGEGACCGGGGGSISVDIPQKTLDHPILGKKTVKISGMHCEHCVKAVTEAINKIDGAAAKVDISRNEAVVSYDRELDDEILRRTVRDAGYRVVNIH